MNFSQKICSIALGLTLLVSNLAKASENKPSTTQSENIETEKAGEVSFGFRAGSLYGCLERQKYDPQNNKPEQNMAIVAFCLCFLEEILSIAVVEGSYVVLPTDVSDIQEKCIHKVKTEVFSE
jgi:hypothetical protein